MLLTPNDLREFLVVCKNDIAEIKHIDCVIDDSQMSTRLSEISEEQNLLLFGVLPDYASDTNDDDALMMDNGFDFLLLKKVDYSNLKSDQFIDVMQETLLVTRKLVTRIYEEKNNPAVCPKFYYLNERNIQIIPVWAKAGCNGYMISINLRTNL